MTTLTATRESLARVWRQIMEAVETQGPQDITLKAHRDTRSAVQNRRMWAMLGDIARQVEWPVDGRMQRLTPDDWKHVLSAGLKRHQRVAMGIDGGFVILGQRTSKMTIAEMGDLIDLMYAFGNDRGVVWSDPEFQSLMQAEQERAA
ncbi:MAG: hypothetical protein CMK46_07055 [Porticoccus sp.]|jgi:hypothetical protein|uniref:recombination protein NinB n=1 Tax=Pseudomonadota TaxID=1224 RepID=UPI000C360154|nr:hypothetical protein [Rhodospirillaceae bacterium]MAY26209.1 hypothetical protein [Polycyclovorans sp.]MBG58032.1 hypothetical protein [Porticoccus sp.]QDP49866.1 MAG: putative NinB protein [Prokaryotic dsDNA virus sp.]MAX61637.1 hypothetical protein [Rhodospirillaceae bacterium]|tara:strand:+ start:15658 stop:16098 length:441 start_codon:yes stop_codon:yes gene_type:complete